MVVDYVKTDKGILRNVQNDQDRLQEEILRRRKLFSALGSPVRYQEEENESLQSQDPD